MPLTDEQRQRIHAIDRVLKQVDADLTRVGEFSPEGEPIRQAIEALLDERAQAAPELMSLRQIDEAMDQVEAALEACEPGSAEAASARDDLERLHAERGAILASLGVDANLADPAPPEPDPSPRRTWIDRFWARLLGGA